MLGDMYNPNNTAPLSNRINNFYYSLDMGPAHLILFSTEFYYYPQYGWNLIKQQYEWLETDLIKANENRAQRPWIIVMGHRPMYCFMLGETSCNILSPERVDLRLGIHMFGDTKSERQYGLESLFYKYGVDVQLYGHEHNFIRTKPMFDFKSEAIDPWQPYNFPNAPIHIVTGNAVIFVVYKH